MTTSDPADRDLRAEFEGLRDEVSASAPSFSTLASRGVKRQVPRWIPITAGLATATAALVVTFVTLQDPPMEAIPSLNSVVWRAPTDFLLDTPSSSRLGTLPAIGGGLLITTVEEPTPISDDTLS